MTLHRLTTALLLLGLLAGKLQAAPGDILFQEQFNDTADLTADWTITPEMRVNPVTGSPAPSFSVEGRTSANSATSRVIDTAVPAASLSFWVRRGYDTQGGNCPANRSCSEYPENGENFRVQYLNDANVWITLITYTGGGTSGQIFNYNQPLPADALHSNFQLRFTHMGGNTNQQGWDYWHADDVTITETVDLTEICATTSTIFSESFNNNGDLNSDWDTDAGVRINSVTFGAASPSVSIDGRSGLHGITSKRNRIDANVSTALLNFWVRRGFDTQGGGCPTNRNCSEDTDNNENLVVEYLDDSDNWQPVITYPGIGTKGEILNYSNALPSNALHSNLRLRFMHTGGSGSTWDLWHIDDVLVEQCTGSARPHHYHIQLPATAVSCETIRVDITAHDASHNAVDAQGRELTITTSTNKGIFTDASPQFASGASSLTTYLRYSDLGVASSESFYIDVTDGQISEHPTEDPEIEISLSGLRFLNRSDNSTVIPTQVAGVPSPQQLYIQAVETKSNAANPSEPFCEGLYPSTAVTLRMAGECKDPSTCTLSEIKINGKPIDITNDNGGPFASSFEPIDVTFDAESKAPIAINYADVGQIQLHVEDPAENLTGSSNDFVVRPHHFAVTSVPGNPQTTGMGAGFVPAGQAFSATVEARNSDGAVTRNYGRESTPETVSASLGNLVFPAGGNTGNLSDPAGFAPTANPGEFNSNTLAWDDVGTITLVADVADGDYLGTDLGALNLQESENIGRLYPADFAVSGSSLDTWCEATNAATGTFSYLSQPNLRLAYTLTARNSAGNTVLNYDSTDLDYPTGTTSYHAENSDNGTDLVARTAVSTTATWDDGVFDVIDGVGQLNRAATLEVPLTSVQFSLGISDPDGAALDINSRDENPTTSGNCIATNSCTTAGFGSAQQFRFGRAIIENASGPETAPLPVVFGTQYWNGSNFVISNDDVCSTLALGDIAYDGITPISNPQPVSVGSGTSNGTLNTFGPLAAVMSGSFDLEFSAPNDTGQFPVSVDLEDYPWLRFDWNQDGDHSNDSTLPDATINFGTYRGHDRVIYWRERFE